jgi:hypothetical protein
MEGFLNISWLFYIQKHSKSSDSAICQYNETETEDQIFSLKLGEYLVCGEII